MSIGLRLLEKELSTLRRCKDKSVFSYSNGRISDKVHRKHVRNLDPQIESLENDIVKLKQ